jgi:hypothetical protein
MKHLLAAAGAFACFGIIPAANAAPMGYAVSQPSLAAVTSNADVVLIKDDKHYKGHKHKGHKYKGHKGDKKYHSDNGRHLAKGHYKGKKGHNHYRYDKGDRIIEYVIVERPQRYGLTRYDRYVQQDGYIYAVDPSTNYVLALIGLASRFLN